MDGLSSAQRRTVKELKSFTGASVTQAIDLLEQCEWSIEQAADVFFSSGMVAEEEKVAVDFAKINAWFDDYREDDSPDLMGADGVQRFCEDINVDPEDEVMLVVSEHMRAATICQFTRDEFRAGCERMGCSTSEELQSKIGQIRSELEQPDRLQEVYMFVHGFAKEPGQKSLAVESAVALWRIVLRGRFALLDEWCDYVLEKRRHPVTRDEWAMLLEFSQQMGADLSNYDDDGAWPVLIDDFVEDRRDVAKRQKKSK